MNRIQGETTALQMPRLAKILAYGSIVCYLILSILFYRERMLLLDGANFLTGMINNGGFYLPLGRLAAWPTQVLPVIAIKLSLPLTATVFLYSLNIAMFYLSIILLLDRYYKNKMLMLSLGIFLWVFTYDSFYMPVSEIAFGIAFVHLFLAHIQHSNKQIEKRDILILSIYSIHIVLSHPLIVFPLFFCFLYYTFTNNHQLRSTHVKILNILLMLIVAMLVVKVLIVGNAEVNKVSRIGRVASNYKTLFIDQDANWYLKKYITTSHLPGLIALLYCSIVLVVNKAIRHLIVLYACLGLFTLVYLIAHPGSNPRVFMEIYFLVAAFFLSFYLAFTTIRSNQNWMIIPIAVIVLVQVIKVVDYHSFFVKRNMIYDQVFEQMESQSIQKAVLPFYTAPMRKVQYISGTGHESLLKSKLRDPQQCMTFSYFLGDSISTASFSDSSTIFINNEWASVFLNDYNLNFFNLDTTKPYQVLYPEYQDID